METILVVDDDVTLARTTRRLLERGGYRVLVAHSPGQALELVAQHGTGISGAVVDVMMPGMTGPELGRRLTDGGFVVKVLYASAFTPDRVPEIDPANFIQKPFTADDLVRRVHRLLGRE
jgi:two-component system cell cycle sensor histidine kinase/response regulator CckA